MLVGVRRFRSHLSFSNVVSLIALFVALGGVSYAAVSAIPGPDGVIHGCYQKHKGSLRVVAKGKKCSKAELTISWNKQGTPGVQGMPGTQGNAGPTGPQGAQGVAGNVGAAGPTWAASGSDGFTTAPTTETPFSQVFHVPSAGNLVINGTSLITRACDGGSAHTCDWTFGIFVDGTQIPNTDWYLSAAAGAGTGTASLGWHANVSVAAGDHTVTVKGGINNIATEGGTGSISDGTQLNVVLAGS